MNYGNTFWGSRHRSLQYWPVRLDHTYTMDMYGTAVTHPAGCRPPIGPGRCYNNSNCGPSQKCVVWETTTPGICLQSSDNVNALEDYPSGIPLGAPYSEYAPVYNFDQVNASTIAKQMSDARRCRDPRYQWDEWRNSFLSRTGGCYNDCMCNGARQCDMKFGNWGHCKQPGAPVLDRSARARLLNNNKRLFWSRLPADAVNCLGSGR